MKIHLEFKPDGNGIISEKVKGGQTEKLSTEFVLADFYRSLAQFLISKGYIDKLGTASDMKKGEFLGWHAKLGEFQNPKDNKNRFRAMFEKEFEFAKNKKSSDFEFVWEARIPIPHSEYGWMEVFLKLTCRPMFEKEILIGNSKKTLQSGRWEFRNQFHYKNSIVKDFLNKTTIVKNSDNLKKLYINRVYYKKMKADFEYCEDKLIPELYEFMLTKMFNKS